MRRVSRYAAVTFVAAAAISAAPPEPAVKGIRALVFSGESMREPVRVGDIDVATDLYVRFLRGWSIPADSAAIVEGRRCVIVATFMANQVNLNTPVDQLPPGRGNFNYRLYLFADGVGPIMGAGHRLWRLTADVTRELSALGVPTADTTRSAPRCD